MDNNSLKAEFRTEAFYQAYQPAAHLQDFIHEYWIMHLDQTAAHSKAELELPTLYPEIIFKYGEDYEELHINKQQGHICKKSIIAGIHSYAKASKRVNTKNDLLLIGIKFRPLGMHTILSHSLYQFFNASIPLEDVNIPALNELEEKLYAAEDGTAIVALLHSTFNAIFSKNDLSSAELQWMNAIDKMNYDSLQSLINNRKSNYKQLERKFKKFIGINPKQYFKLKRFNYFYKDLLMLKKHRYIDLVYKHNYYDQNHLIKDFKAIMNTSPNKFLKNSPIHFTQHILEAHL